MALARSARRRVLSLEQNKKGRAPRSTFSAGALPRPTSCHIRWASTQVRLVDSRYRPITSRGKIAEIPFGRIP